MRPYIERFADAVREALEDSGAVVDVPPTWQDVFVTRGNARVRVVPPAAADRRSHVSPADLSSALRAAASRLNRDIPHYRAEFREPARDLYNILRATESH
jgi:hypothetical protein